MMSTTGLYSAFISEASLRQTVRPLHHCAGCCRSRGQSRRLGNETYDPGELLGVEAGTTDEHAVDIRLRHERVYVARLDAAAVKNAHRVGRRTETYR